MLSRPVRQAPRVIARLASSANEASSSANEGAKKSAEQQKNYMPYVAGVIGCGIVAKKLLGR